MVNTRAKIKKTQNALKTCFSQPSTDDSDHQFTPSAALLASNDDLLTEILLRLPVTALLRFKSVSKHWQSLLTHPPFTLLYDNLSISPGLFIRNLYIPFNPENRSTPPFRSLDFYPDLCGIRIVQSCNGLLLCCSDRGNERSRKYYVFNPTTKQFAVLPSVPGGQEVRKSIRFMGLAFHRTGGVHYEIVCILRSRVTINEGLFHIQIYSSSTNKWKISDNYFPASYYTIFRNGVFWNGAIHWALSTINPSYFNLESEKLQNFSLPSPLTARVASYDDGNLPLYFGESGGHLHLVDTEDYETNYLHLNVYEMLEDCCGWFVKYKVDLDELPVAYPEMIQSYQSPTSPHYYDFEIIDLVRGYNEEGEENVFMVVKIPGKIIRYNILDRSFKGMFDLSEIYHGRIGYSEVHSYIPSLTSF